MGENFKEVADMIDQGFEVMEEETQTTNEVRAAAEELPPEVIAEVWPSKDAKAAAENAEKPTVGFTREEQEALDFENAPGIRAQLVKKIFKECDIDEDNRLSEFELK